MSDRPVVGTRPVLPKFLREWTWFSAPAPAERLAALRIAIGLVLLLDILATYVPFRYDYFGPGSLSEPDVFSSYFQSPRWSWSLIRWLPQVFTPDVICSVWAVAALFLLAGLFPRVAAVVAWAIAVSVNNSAGYFHNTGDFIRQQALLFLALTPCGAMWALTRPPGSPRTGPVAVYPWAIRLMFIELVVMYFFNGVYKVAFSARWRDGSTLHHVWHAPGWARWSPPVDVPFALSAGITFFVLAWELLFPLLVLIKPTRVPALVIGAAFHFATFWNLEIGPFGLYALCFYVPLLPWERLTPTESAV
ncbi:MAG: HTTM domain-containing protein [Gemmataceae bacterium]|nr:HTTM domain-containing protein [Gemmataceae bacterium]